MGTFNTKKILYGSSSLIPTIAQRIQEEFLNDGYEVVADPLSSGGCDISITKGGVFKAVLGMKSALKVTLIPSGNNINFEAGVGIWGQQAIPTVISMLFFWPVLVTQIWGMVEQSKLDDRALAIAEDTINRSSYNASGSFTGSGNSTYTNFCIACGSPLPQDAKFCPECGKKI